jgi:hypothetical protein
MRRLSLSQIFHALVAHEVFSLREAAVVSVAGAGFVLVFCYPLIHHLSAITIYGDWDIWLGTQWAAGRSITHFHQLPLWNPYECGGNPLLGNPQSHFLTPWFVFTLIFGPAVGLHVEVLLDSLIAWMGAYVLGRVVGMRRLAAGCTAITFAGSSWFYLRAAEGQFALLPLVYCHGYAQPHSRPLIQADLPTRSSPARP